jgi:DNA polymerase III subunit gamma/tau
MSLHTKYRPQTFDEVLGQDVIVRSLKKAIKANRARAFLFVGPAGTGKTTLARITAAALSPGAPVSLYEYDGVSNSGKDKAKELVSKLYYKAIGASPVKFVVIDECHRLSADAWDVFLKPIEEPPEHVYYAFCTTVLGKIPKAIITRCVRYDLKPVPEELITELLVRVVDAEQIQISDEIIEAIAENVEGSPRQALVFLETCIGAKSVADALQLMRTASQGKDVVDLCKFLISGSGHSWANAMKYVKALEGQDPEGLRVVVCNYIAAVLVKTTNEEKARHLLRMLEVFSKPYIQSDKLAPLLLSIGLAMGLDQ